MIQPGIEFTYEATAALGTPISIGDTADGARRIIPILDGRVEGPLIRGEIIGGGTDWQLTRPDGVTVLDATYALKTVAATKGPETKLAFTVPELDPTLSFAEFEGFRHGLLVLLGHKLITGFVARGQSYPE